HDRPPVPHLDLPLSLGWTVEALPLFLRATVVVLLARSGVVALGSYADAETVGYFAAAERLIAAADLPLIMFTTAVFPILSRLADRPAEFGPFLRYAVRLGVAGAIVIAVALWLLREPVIALLYGDGFERSATILGILAAGVPFTAANTMMSMALIARQRLWWLFFSECLSLVLLYAVLVLTIDDLGGAGLALAILAAKLLRVLALAAGLGRSDTELGLWPVLLRAGSAAAAVAAALWLTSGWPAPVHAGSAAVVTLVVLAATGVARRDDVERLRRKMTGRPANAGAQGPLDP
ncbi:MAG: lipid II flippase MurJ, partial [Pseudomonadota bacterium]